MRHRPGNWAAETYQRALHVLPSLTEKPEAPLSGRWSCAVKPVAGLPPFCSSQSLSLGNVAIFAVVAAKEACEANSQSHWLRSPISTSISRSLLPEEVWSVALPPS